jgi:uncharacterized membrane protein YgdD (TMEM256/DUF423 family)
LNDEFITIFPVYNNFDLATSLWVWKDISAFSVTYGLTLLLCVYLLIRNLKPGYLISASLNLVVILFIYFSIWLTSIKTEDFSDVTFSYSIYGLLIIAGFVLLFYSGLKIEKSKKQG